MVTINDLLSGKVKLKFGDAEQLEVLRKEVEVDDPDVIKKYEVSSGGFLIYIQAKTKIEAIKKVLAKNLIKVKIV